ncbi:UDP-N-acetylmuramoyl-tripeptide--D-alanyl-D-alanine ligase [Paludibacterium paludis]|uniref:UDP-N-acetylmuramoyl-tripeptide--D-alanyl-D-alanine ligase n=1 Tax=Paludibacterium paludis TaxID=1225769 RepID=A0A918P0X8_9NEIS|nr:UDP-N-acetylmuramoyl-tripeptide--D-alanyl-D-alanine ligase [Paludibacterium paludis]GGY09288.1 UDP-N-acetylmuramoyl-tripeptide--D-alanyl-D-alanine ligase [Paludibacterium paludis]
MLMLSDAARLAGGELTGGDRTILRVTTDSRTVRAGDLFVALKGERFDAHDFVADALSRGASAALVARGFDLPGAPLIAVDDTRLALGRLAAGWRRRFSVPLVGITGSNGKTTVKEMLAAILRAKAGEEAVLATRGNLNNDIGLPLTLLELNDTHRYAVIEMGMNHTGEIDYLTRIAAPDVALVNNAMRAHLGEFDGVEGIARAKGEIFAGLGPDGIAVINLDDANAARFAEQNCARRRIGFGLAGADVTARDVALAETSSRFVLVAPDGEADVALPAAGEHNVRNALAAAALAHALGLGVEDIAVGLAAFRGVKGRLMRIAAQRGVTLIDDTYNANPDSMKAGLDVLARASAPRVFVMGDIGELGDTAPALHAEVGEHARRVGIEVFVSLGATSRHAADAFGEGARHFESIEPLLAWLDGNLEPGSTVLVKGSRFMRMERVVEHLSGHRKEGV